ncbi:MAG: MFS transporter [Candidatus Izimaplasma sp.]|nr:MFS transporter [Candidatus Izimaplasma bacterium]
MKKTEFKNRANIWQLIGFAGNNAATNALFVVLGSFFLVYGSDVYGYTTLLIGFVMGGTRIFDAITDPLIGILVDKTNTKLGRFRPWMIAGSLLANLMFLILFWGIDLGNSTLNLVFIIAIYVIWVIGYTFQTSISKAGQNVLTSDPKQRTTLNAISGMFSVVVFMSAFILYPIVIPQGFTNIAANWQKLAIIMVVVQLFFTLIAVLGIWKKDVPENYEIGTVTENPKIKDYISLFKGNKALQMLIVAASTNKITMTIGNGLLVFFYAYVVKNPAMQSSVTPVTIIFMILATVSILIYTNKVGRKKAFTILSIGAMTWGILSIFILPFAPSSFLMLVFVLGVNAFFMGGTDLNVIPMIGDAADYENYTNGRFIPGMIGTSFSLIDKLVSSLGTVISGALLTMLGFVSLTSTPTSDKLFWGILIAYFIFPAFGHLCSIIAMKYYPIDNDFMNHMHKTLEERRNEI